MKNIAGGQQLPVFYNYLSLLFAVTTEVFYKPGLPQSLSGVWNEKRLDFS